MVGSAPDEMYITDDKLIFGSHEIYIDDVEDIEVTSHENRDWIALGIVSSNTITGTILSYTITSDLLIIAPIVILSTLLGISVVKIVNQKPFAFVSMETQRTEYRFGIRNQFDMATLFAIVKGDFEDEVNQEYVLNQENEDDTKENNKEQKETQLE
jgi:hypothetical protein